MRVAVLGIGNIGGTLGGKWAAAGHRVTYGVRDVNAPRARDLAAASGDNVSVETVGGAIEAGEVVVFAVPGPAVESVVAEHAAALDGKVVVDATNRIGEEEMSSIPVFVARTPAARVFRAFNSMGWENFAEPRFDGLAADLFYCGHEDREARQAVEMLIADAGLRPVRVGGLDQVSVVDGVLRLWFALAIGQRMGRHLAFKVLVGEAG